MSGLSGFRDNKTRDPRANVVTPPPTLANLVTIGSLATHQILAQLATRIPRYRDGGAPPHVQRCPTPPMTCEKHVLSDPPTHIPNLNTIGQAVPEIQKRGVHVRTCRDTPPMNCVKHLVPDPQLTHLN